MPWRNNTITTRLGMWNPPHAVILNILNHCIGLLIMVCTVMPNSGPGLMYTDRRPEDTRAWYQYLHLWQPLGIHSVSFHQHAVSCMYMIEFLFLIFYFSTVMQNLQIRGSIFFSPGSSPIHAMQLFSSIWNHQTFHSDPQASFMHV